MKKKDQELHSMSKPKPLEDPLSEIKKDPIWKSWFRNITKPIPDSKGGRGSFQQCINNNQDKHNPGGWCKQIERKISGVKKRHKPTGGHPTKEERSDPTYHGEPEETRRGRKDYREWLARKDKEPKRSGSKRSPRARIHAKRERDAVKPGMGDYIEYNRDYDEHGKLRDNKKPAEYNESGHLKPGSGRPHMTMVHPRTNEIIDVDAESAKESRTGKQWKYDKHGNPPGVKNPPKPKPKFDKRGNPIELTDEEQQVGLDELMGKEKALRLWLEDKGLGALGEGKLNRKTGKKMKLKPRKITLDEFESEKQIDEKARKKRESKEKGKPKHERPCPTCGQHIGSANLVRMLKPSMVEARREGEKRWRERKLREPRENEDEKMEAKHSDANKTDYFVEEIRSNIIYHDKIAPLIGMIAGQAAQGLSEQGKKQGKQALDAVGEMSEEEQ